MFIKKMCIAVSILFARVFYCIGARAVHNISINYLLWNRNSFIWPSNHWHYQLYPADLQGVYWGKDRFRPHLQIRPFLRRLWHQWEVPHSSLDGPHTLEEEKVELQQNGLVAEQIMQEKHFPLCFIVETCQLQCFCFFCCCCVWRKRKSI